MAPRSPTFSITELRRTGAAALVSGARFEWPAVAHAMPEGPIEVPVKVTTAREVLPGGGGVVEQVISVEYAEDVRFKGVWDDKWAGRGFALATKNELIRLVARAPLVRVQWNREVYEGILTEFVPAYHDDSRIGYELTLSVHTSPVPQTDTTLPPVPRTPRAAADALQVAAEAAAALQLDARALPPAGDGWDRVGAAMDEVVQGVAELHDALGVGEVADAAAHLRDLSSRFNEIRAISLSTVGQLRTARSDIDIAVDTAVGVLGFDYWRGTVAHQMWKAIVAANGAREDLEDRIKAAPARIYRPAKGETVYDVAAAAYGNPAEWRGIYEANNLAVLTFDGDEELVIPERAVASL